MSSQEYRNMDEVVGGVFGVVVARGEWTVGQASNAAFGGASLPLLAGGMSCARQQHVDRCTEELTVARAS